MQRARARILQDLSAGLQHLRAPIVRGKACAPFVKPVTPVTPAEAIRSLSDRDLFTMILAEVARRKLGHERFGDGISRHGHEAYRRMMNKGWS